MTTDVHERLITPPIVPQRPRGARAWLVFLVTVVLAAVVIGIMAALLGNAVRGLEAANASAAEAKTALGTAQGEVAAAEEALRAGQTAIDERRQEIIDEIAAQPHEPGFSISGSSPAFAEVRAMQDSLQANEAAAVDAANRAETAAAASVETSAAAAQAAQREVDGLVGPLWIASGAAIVVIGLVLWAAIARTRTGRRRARRS